MLYNMKTKNYCLLLFFTVAFILPASSQIVVKPRQVIYRELSMGLNSLFQHLPILPLGDSDLHTYDILYRRQRRHKRSATRFGFSGAFVVGGGGNNTQLLSSFVLRWGRERYNNLFENWTYYTGYDFLIFAENNGGGGIGTGPIAGLRYDLNERISLSAEGALYLTIGGVNPTVSLSARPPSSLTMNVRFYKQTPKL